MVGSRTETQDPLDAIRGLVAIQTLARYDRPLAFLAAPRDEAAESSERWLFAWRTGGRWTAGRNTPQPLWGADTWLALPLSPIRTQQLLDRHVSLNEALHFAENGLYLVLGDDPLDPRSANAIDAYSIPQDLKPAGDASIFGGPLQTPIELSTKTPVGLMVHMVPGGGGETEPDLLVQAAIQSSLQRFVSWSAFTVLSTNLPEGAGLTSIPPAGVVPANVPPIIAASDWSALRLHRAQPGTLALEASSRELDTAQLGAMSRSFEFIQRTSKGDAIGAASTLGIGDGSEESVLALFGLVELVHGLKVSLNIKWRAGAAIGSALIGIEAATIAARQLAPYVAERARADPENAIVEIHLAEDEARVFSSRILDPMAGGYQQLHEELRAALGEDNVLRLRADLVERVIRYAQDYGGGGFQARLRPVYRALHRMGLAFVGVR